MNVAEALHAAAAGYRFTHNATGESELPVDLATDLDICSSTDVSDLHFKDLAAIGQAWDIVFKYHGRPSGIFAADEYLAGLEAARGCVAFGC